MAERMETGRLGRVLAPLPFGAGAVCAFLACCLAGWVASDRNCYDDFVRFHLFIAPDTKFYPTASQVRALGRARLDRDRVAVVVGGNSILFGYGQGSDGVWTRRLQEELGDRYRVINLGMRGATPSEFGEAAAEMLAGDRPKLLFVTDCGTSTMPGDPDGGAYLYFYWDAYYKGLLPPDPRREACVAARAAKRDNAFRELQRGERLDSGLRFQDLWTTVACERLATVWTPQTASRFPLPRRCYDDIQVPQPPLEVRYPPFGSREEEGEKQILRTMFLVRPALIRPPLEDCPLVQDVRDCFPETCRRRTLILVVRDSPHYVSRLDPAEQAAYAGVFPTFVRALEAGGLSALDVGADYSEMDYYDRCHLSEQGGRRLAADVAPKLRDMAEKLGYLDQGGDR